MRTRSSCCSCMSHICGFGCFEREVTLFRTVVVALSVGALRTLATTTSTSEVPITIATYSVPTLTPGMDETELPAALSSIESTLEAGGVDIACLQDTYVDTKTLLAGMPQFGYGFEIPAKKGECKCTPTEVATLFSSVMACWSAACSGKEMSETMNCLMGPDCLGQLWNQISEPCIGCIAAELVGGLSDPFSLVQRCTAESGVEMVTDCSGPYGGRYGVAILSKYPIVSTIAMPFPNSIVCNRGFVYIGVEVECGHTVEVACGWWRSNATILGRFGQGYYPPQDGEAYYGVNITSPLQEAILQADHTAAFVNKYASVDHPVVVAGNFAVGPDVPAAGIRGATPEAYDRHSDGLQQAGFSNPFLNSSTARGGQAMCSDCMTQVNLQQVSDWMGRNISEEAFQIMLGNMGDILIDHLFFRPPDVVSGPGSISAVQAHRLNLPHGVDGIRYPVALSFRLSVPAQCDAPIKRRKTRESRKQKKSKRKGTLMTNKKEKRRRSKGKKGRKSNVSRKKKR